MRRYRYRTPALTGPWRPSAEQALQDAIRARQVRLDGAEAPDPVWVVPGSIEEGLSETVPSMRSASR